MPTAALQWYFAEGATGDFFDLLFLIANPGAQASVVEATYLKPDGTTFRVTNGVPVVIERAMWWAGDPTRWVEGHDTAGATASGDRWALAEGEVGGAPFFTDTYILVANLSTTPGTVRVTLLFEDGTAPVSRDIDVSGSSRLDVSVRDDFPEAVGKRFGAIVESVGATSLQLVVERAMYDTSEGVAFSAGTAALGARLR